MLLIFWIIQIYFTLTLAIILAVDTITLITNPVARSTVAVSPSLAAYATMGSTRCDIAIVAQNGRSSDNGSPLSFVKLFNGATGGSGALFCFVGTKSSIQTE